MSAKIQTMVVICHVRVAPTLERIEGAPVGGREPLA